MCAMDGTNQGNTTFYIYSKVGQTESWALTHSKPSEFLQYLAMFALLKGTLLLLNREWERNFSKKFRVGGTIQPTISTKSHKKKQTNMSPIFIVCKYLISRNINQHHQSWGERASEQIVWPIFVAANFPKHYSIGSIWVCSDTPTTDTALFCRIYSQPNG